MSKPASNAEITRSKGSIAKAATKYNEIEVAARVPQFNSKLNYDYLLNVFEKEFNDKWENNAPSLETGLEGFLVLAKLGKGGFGKVVLVNEVGTKFYYACKIMDKAHIVKMKQVSHVLSEKHILNCIDFPNLLNLKFSRKDNDNLYLGLPLLLGGELFIYHRVLGKFNEHEARFYASQVFLALQYLHNVQVVYRDIKPENICFERNGYITIIDFGFAKRVAKRTMTLCGTPEYLAPEILSTTPYGHSVDWWSFGILIYEFVNGSSPFSNHASNVMNMYEKIIIGDFSVPNFFSPELKGLITGLLQTDMTKRLGNVHNKEIKLHDWFKDVDWYGVLNQKLKPPYVPNVRNSANIFKIVTESEQQKNSKKAPKIQYDSTFALF